MSAPSITGNDALLGTGHLGGAVKSYGSLTVKRSTVAVNSPAFGEGSQCRRPFSPYL